MSIARALHDLLTVVASDRQARCQAILDHADAETATLLAGARADARRRLRAAAQAERRRGQRLLADAQTRLQTAQRQRNQRLAVLALAEGMSLLEAALQARWQDAETRRRWLALATERAACLAPHDWLLRHPPELPDHERDELLAQAAALGVRGARCEATADIAAGLEIRAGDTRLDATTAGLLADHPAVEGRLLHHLEAP